MDKVTTYLFREAIFEKISNDNEIQRLVKKLNIDLDEKCLKLILDNQDPVLGFLAKEDLSREISIFSIGEHGYDHKWLFGHEKFMNWSDHDYNELSYAHDYFERKMILQFGGSACILPKSNKVKELQNDLVEFVTGRKVSSSATVELISPDDISMFFDRMLNPNSPDKITTEEVLSPSSQFSNALQLIIKSSPFAHWRAEEKLDEKEQWNAEIFREQQEKWEAIGIPDLIQKYWIHGLKDSPKLPIEEILFFFPKLWLTVKDTVDLKKVYAALDGCLGLDDFRLLREDYPVHEIYGRLSCFRWFPEIVEAEQDSICWLNLSGNENLEWTDEIIRKWADKVDFKLLSRNRSVRWTVRLIRDYVNEWDWGLLCQNESVPWNADLIKMFEDRIKWPQLSGNRSLPWSGELLDEFSGEWVWKKQEGNHIYVKGCWYNAVSHSLNKWDSHRYPWGGFSLSSNEGIKWTPDLLLKYENQLDVWVLAAKACLDASCVRYLFNQLSECRPALKYGQKWSDFGEMHFNVSLTGWHLLFLNKNAIIDAALLDDIYLMKFKATPDLAVSSHRWSGPEALGVLDLLFPSRFESNIKVRYDINLTECVERSATWGSSLMKYAIQVQSRYERDYIEKQFATLLLDVRSELKSRRQELFDFKVKIWKEKRRILRDELLLREIWHDLMAHSDFDDAVQYLKQRGGDLSVAEAWLSRFVISCRYRITYGFHDVLQGFGLRMFRDVRFQAYQDLSVTLKEFARSDDSGTGNMSLYHYNNQILLQSADWKDVTDYFQWWQTHKKVSRIHSEFQTSAEVVFLPEKREINQLLASVLRELGFMPNADFGIAAHHFDFGFLGSEKYVDIDDVL